eukprot:8978016-Pyramimonas_sp.AAC.1
MRCGLKPAEGDSVLVKNGKYNAGRSGRGGEDEGAGVRAFVVCIVSAALSRDFRVSMCVSSYRVRRL